MIRPSAGGSSTTCSAATTCCGGRPRTSTAAPRTNTAGPKTSAAGPTSWSASSRPPPPTTTASRRSTPRSSRPWRCSAATSSGRAASDAPTIPIRATSSISPPSPSPNPPRLRRPTMQPRRAPPGSHPPPRPLRAPPPHPHRARPRRGREDLLLLRGPQGPHRRGRVARARVHPGPAGGPRPRPAQVRLLEVPRRRRQPAGPAQAHPGRHRRARPGRLRGRQQVRRSPAAVSTRRYLDATRRPSVAEHPVRLGPRRRLCARAAGGPAAGPGPAVAGDLDRRYPRDRAGRRRARQHHGAVLGIYRRRRSSLHRL